MAPPESPRAASSSLDAAPVPFSWVDLPGYLWEKILERLTVDDYVRFGAVCPQLCSIQSDHHRCYAPSRPPMVTRPWFIPRRPEEESVLCSDPFSSQAQQQRAHRLRIPLSERYLEYRRERGEELQDGEVCSFSLPDGWLLLQDRPDWGRRSYYMTLLNPLLGNQIELPQVGHGLCFDCKAAASTSSPPGIAVLLVMTDKWATRLRLFRVDDDPAIIGPYDHWHYLDYKEFSDPIPLEQVSPIFWQGKFYCMFLGGGLIVIDPLPKMAEVYLLEMDQSLLPVLRWPSEEDCMNAFLVESTGRLLLVFEFWLCENWQRTSITGFQVFEADFDRRRWVEVESLGDCVLLVHGRCVVSLAAADIGAKNNCIYFIGLSQEKELVTWKEFDMDTGEMTDASLECAPSPSTHLMFVPSMY